MLESEVDHYVVLMFCSDVSVLENVCANWIESHTYVQIKEIRMNMHRH